MDNLRSIMDALKTNLVLSAVVDTVFTPENNNGNGSSRRHVLRLYTGERVTIFEDKPLNVSALEGTKQYIDVKLSVYNGRVSYAGSIITEEEARTKLFGNKLGVAKVKA